MKICCPACLDELGHGNQRRAAFLAYQHAPDCRADDQAHEAAVYQVKFEQVMRGT